MQGKIAWQNAVGVIVVVEVVREPTAPWESKIGVVSGVILKVDGIGVGRIGMSPFLQIPYGTPSLMIQ